MPRELTSAVGALVRALGELAEVEHEMLPGALQGLKVGLNLSLQRLKFLRISQALGDCERAIDEDVSERGSERQ